MLLVQVQQFVRNVWYPNPQEFFKNYVPVQMATSAMVLILSVNCALLDVYCVQVQLIVQAA